MKKNTTKQKKNKNKKKQKNMIKNGSATTYV